MIGLVGDPEGENPDAPGSYKKYLPLTTYLTLSSTLAHKHDKVPYFTCTLS